MATNLHFIKEFNSTSSMASASLTDCFNAEYDTYEIYVKHISTNSSVMYLYGRLLDSSNNPITTSNYDWSGYDMHSDTTFTEQRGNNLSYFFVIFAGGVNYQQMGGLKLVVYNPYSSSNFTSLTIQGSLQDSLNNNHLMGNKGIVNYKVAETIKGIQFYGNTLDEGMKFSVYGVK